MCLFTTTRVVPACLFTNTRGFYIYKLNWYIVKYYRAYLRSLLDNGPKVLRISALIIVLCSWNFRKILLVSVNCKVEFFPKAYFMCLNYILPYIWGPLPCTNINNSSRVYNLMCVIVGRYWWEFSNIHSDITYFEMFTEQFHWPCEMMQW